MQSNGHDAARAPAMSARAVRRPVTALILSALVLLAAAANLFKAVHIDDTAYLEMALGILQSPLRPMSVSLNWVHFAEPAWVNLNQPPLFFYVLAGVMAVFGRSELVAHALMAVISAVAIVLFYGVARRTAQRRPLFLTALFALGPAFLPGQNVMTDVPLLVAWLVCFNALLAAGLRKGFARQYAVAAVAIAAACLIKYVSLALLPVFALVVIHRRHWRSLWLLAIPLAVLGGWSLWNYLEYGAVHMLDRPTTLQAARIGTRALEWLAGVGVAAPFGVVFWSQRSWGRRLRVPACALPVAAGWVVFELARSEPCPPFGAILWGISVCIGLMSVLFVLGGLLVGRAHDEPDTTRDATLVVTWWLLAAFGSIVALALFMAMRHILLALPPLLLLCGMFGEQVFSRRSAALVAAVATAGFGIAMAASDYAYADVYRRWAPRIAATATPGHAMWAVGHWGWQWYAGKAGMQVYDQHTTVLKRGDLLAASAVAAGQSLRPEHASRLRLVRTLEIPATPLTYLRTFRQNPWGGYYSFRWMNRTLPFSLTRDPLDVFDVYVVE